MLGLKRLWKHSQAQNWFMVFHRRVWEYRMGSLGPEESNVVHKWCKLDPYYRSMNVAKYM